MKSERNYPLRMSWDFVGIALSFLCLLHCLFLPFLFALLPAIGLQIFKHDLVHKILGAGVTAAALLAFIPGLKIHKRVFVLAVAGTGLLLILIAAFYAGETWGGEAERWLTCFGGCALIAAHVLNKSFCHTCLKCRDVEEKSCEALR